MKKLCLTFSLVLLCFAFLAAEPVGEAMAVEIGQKWLQNACSGAESKEIASSVGVGKNGIILYYILSARDGGWVLVAADDSAMPILGYSESGIFEYPITCPAVEYWMGTYEEQIAEAIAGSYANDETRPFWDQILEERLPDNENDRAVSPLCSTIWNQNNPYNSYCPSSGGITAYAGCVATAMAQVMKKWNWPSYGIGSHSYQDGSTYLPNYGTISANLNVPHNWASMPNSISTADYDICTLIYHCGVAVDMDYGSAASAALVFTNDAMEKYFSYDPAAQWQWRYLYTDSTWDTMMKSDLNLGRPIVYQGYNASNTTGHSFVMDGYNNSSPTGFHFNFGWGGYYDGYYPLNGIVPVSGTDFSYFQWAYYNIFPGVSVSGTITDASSNPLSNVSVSFSGAGTVLTDANGFYSITLSQGYSGTATPTLAGYAFTPASRSYSNLTTIQTLQNYSGSQSVPADPSNANATALAYDQVQLTWTDNSNNESGFNIDCKLVTDLSWYYRGTVGPNATAFLDVGLMPMQSYIYRVTAFNGAGNSNPAISPTVTTLAPPAPVGLWAPTVNFTDAWLDWTEAGSATAWDLEFGPPGFTVGTGTYLPLLPNHPFNLQGLNQGTPYDWYVRSYYPSVNVYSAWSGPGNFTTQGTPMLPYPWFEGFEAGFVNMISDPAGSIPWALDTTLFSQGIQSAWCAYQASNTDILVTTNPFSLITASFPLLRFDQIAKTENNWDHCYVETSLDNGMSWTHLLPHEYVGDGNYVPPTFNNPEGPCFMESSYPAWSGTTPDNSWWRSEVFDLRAYLGQPSVMLRFRLKSDSSVQRYGWLVDNVAVQESPQFDFGVTVPPNGYVLAGQSVDYLVKVKNKGAQPDTYFISMPSPTGSWTYTLYEQDGVTPLPASVIIPPWTNYAFIIRVTAPGVGVSHLATDYENFLVMSGTTGTGYAFLLGTTYLLGDTVANPIPIGSLPFTDSYTTTHYNHNYGPYGDVSGLVNLLNPITGFYNGTTTLGSSQDVVYQLTLSQPTLLSIDLLGSSYDTALALVASPGTNPTDVYLLNDDYHPSAVSYVNSGCSYVPAGTWYIVIGGWDNRAGNYSLSVAAATPPVQPAVSIQIDTANNRVVLSWTQNTAMRYNIYSDTNPYGSYSTAVATNVNAGTYAVSPIPSPMIYYKVTEKFCYTYPSKDAVEPMFFEKKE